MAIAIINGMQIYYEIHGTGEPLLLIAGLASDSQSWLSVINRLADRYQVITFDNRGVGRRKPSDEFTTIEQMADDCVALIQYLGLSPVHLLGHSMGGFIAQRCAIHYPNVVNRLILAGTSASVSDRNIALFLDWVHYLESGMDLTLWFRNLFTGYFLFDSLKIAKW